MTFAYQVSYAKAVEIVQNYLEQAAFEGEVFLIFPELTNCHVECHLDEKGKHFRFEDSFICNCLIKHECYRNWQVDVYGSSKYDVFHGETKWKHGKASKSKTIPSNNFNYMFYYSTKKWPKLLKKTPKKYGFKKTHDLFFIVDNATSQRNCRNQSFRWPQESSKKRVNSLCWLSHFFFLA